jgi:hypothetical protein
MLRLFALLFALVAGSAQAQVTPGTSPLSGPKGGTNNAFMQFSGPASSLKTYTMPNASGTIALLNQIQTWTAAQTFAAITATTYNGGALSGTFSGTPSFSGANFITLGNLVQSPAGAQFLGVAGASATNYAPFTLASLPALTSPSATLDFLPCVDHTSGTIKSCTPSALTSAVGSGVTSLNGGTGAIVGVDTSTINAQTGNYTVATTDAGKVILASGGMNTITCPSTSGFPSSFTFTIKNNEIYSGIGTANAKILSGCPADMPTRLWPQQSVTFKLNSVGSAWITTYNPGRWILPTGAEICVAQNGNDANDGLGSGTGCMATPQAAVDLEGATWDGGGYNSCSLGFYAGGTSILPGANQTGQSVGCYITINIRGAITWASTGACWTGGDNSITIINWNLGFTPTFKCNSANNPSTGQLKCHQYCVYDLNGGTAIWIPGGNGDVFFDLDLQGSATFNATVDVGDGVNTYAPAAFIQCEAHCSKVTASGSVAFSALVTMGVAFNLHAGSVITTNLTWPGASITNPSTPTGNSVLITNGTTIPGGTSSATGGQVCTTLC